MAEAGYADGFEIDLWAMPVQRPYNPNARKMAVLMQQDLSKIGIKANIVTYEWGTYLKKSREGEHQTILLGWTGDNGDPDNFFTPLLSCAATETGNNRSFWCNQRFDDLISLARIELDQVKRKKLYEARRGDFQAASTLADDCPFRSLSALSEKCAGSENRSLWRYIFHRG